MPYGYYACGCAQSANPNLPQIRARYLRLELLRLFILDSVRSHPAAPQEVNHGKGRQKVETGENLAGTTGKRRSKKSGGQGTPPPEPPKVVKKK